MPRKWPVGTCGTPKQARGLPDSAAGPPSFRIGAKYAAMDEALMGTMPNDGEAKALAAASDGKFGRPDRKTARLGTLRAHRGRTAAAAPHGPRTWQSQAASSRGNEGVECLAGPAPAARPPRSRRGQWG